MTTQEFEKLRTTLAANFPYSGFLKDPESLNILFNSLTRFDFSVTWAAVVWMLKNGVMDRDGARSIAIMDVVRAVEKEDEARKSAEKERSRGREKVAVCPRCKGQGWVDAGYTEKRAAMGIIPCPCAAGRESFPFYFMSEAEVNAWRRDQIKKGQNPVEAHHAPRDFHDWYCYGVEMKK